MANINEKRTYVSGIYPGKNWKNKVKHMSDVQVTAIYLRMKADGDKPKPKKETNDNDEIPF